MKSFVFGLIVSCALVTASQAQERLQEFNLEQSEVDNIVQHLSDTLVVNALDIFNESQTDLSMSEIEELNEDWKREYKSDRQPFIASLLNNPVSIHLIKKQAESLGLYLNIEVMTKKGLSAGQSFSTDYYYHGDEEHFSEVVSSNEFQYHFDKVPEYVKEHGIYKSSLSFPVKNDTGETIGAISVELNLTEILRRRNLGNFDGL